MRLVEGVVRRGFVLLIFVLSCSLSLASQQQSMGTLRGTVADQLGGVIVGATVTVTDAGGGSDAKSSIRDIWISQNPSSAEYDRLGFSRVEIFTMPGADRFRGDVSFNFNDARLNSRNPFASTRAPYQSRRYGGNLSGPISTKKASVFLDFERRETDDNAVVRAVVLDPSFNPVSFNQTILTPDRRTTFSPRLDYQLNPTNTLVPRYTFERAAHRNEGVRDFNLPSRPFHETNTQQTVQATETAVI